MSRNSLARVKRLMQRKAEKSGAVRVCTCSVCGEQIKGTVWAVVQARLTQHWKDAHPHLLDAGFDPHVDPNPTIIRKA